MLFQESNSSDTEVGWNQGPSVACLSPSKDIEDGFTEVPKNVALLESVIKKLRDKVAHRVI
jgi:hypothetical protein